MQLRTDLALEANELKNSFTHPTVRKYGELTVTALDISTDEGAELLSKPKGRYVTIEGLRLTDSVRDIQEHIGIIARELRSLLTDEGMVIVAGLGNIAITPDALGPKSTQYVLATRHLTGGIARASGLDRLRAVSVIAPGVLGQTGIEAVEMIISLVKRLRPSAVIAVDALAARSLSRLGSTIQLSDTGIVPGSGVGNHRMKLDRESIGVPVIAVGIPTVVDAATLACDLLYGNDATEGEVHLPEQSKRMMVTPRETDIMITRAAKLTGMAINCALQPDCDIDTLSALIS